MRRSGTHGLLRVRAQVPQTFRAFFDLTFIAILRSCQEVASSCCAKRVRISEILCHPARSLKNQIAKVTYCN